MLRDRVHSLSLFTSLLVLIALLSACADIAKRRAGTRFNPDGTQTQGGEGGQEGEPGIDFPIDSKTGLKFAFKGTPQQVVAGSYRLAVYPEAKVEADGNEFSLYLTGNGMRRKKVVFVTADVYYAASFVTLPKRKPGETPLDQIEDSPVELMQLTMLRDLGGDQITSSFREALQLNGIDPNRSEFASIFQQLGAGASEGDEILLLTYTQPNGMDRIIGFTPQGEKVHEGKGLGHLLWHAWFGIPLDNEMGKLKTALTRF